MQGCNGNGNGNTRNKEWARQHPMWHPWTCYRTDPPRPRRRVWRPRLVEGGAAQQEEPVESDGAQQEERMRAHPPRVESFIVEASRGMMAPGSFTLLHNVTSYVLLTIILSGFVSQNATDDLKYRATGVIELTIGRELPKCNCDSPAARRSTNSTKLSPSPCLLLLHLTNDVLLMNWLLLCGDIAVNPGPARTRATCGTCLKTIRKINP